METVKTMKKFFFMMLLVVMGSMMVACGSDDDGDDTPPTKTESYKLVAWISDAGTLPAEYVAILNEGLKTYTYTWTKITLEQAKKMLDEALQGTAVSGLDTSYDYTIEYYLEDADGKKVYSRYVVVKDGTATLK